ncbi:hypothetical protein IFM89_025102 [Coptis chinensis]|uniref:Uncharacterized protein n=1 Tax=Coptis chinensis TaxID=261450 RepID=A0A835LSE2_9MAGN|nr:hypothetical protein IFM89_025102 [Coptis chinensis]
MASTTNGLKIKIVFLSLLSLSICFQVLTTIFRLNIQPIIDNHLVNDTFEEPSYKSINSPIPPPRNLSLLYDFFAKEFKDKEIKIGLVNTNKGKEEEWTSLGVTTEVEFHRVSEELQWEDFVREWINEERWPLPYCPEMPMPKLEEYSDFDVVVSTVPCGNGGEGGCVQVWIYKPDLRRLKQKVFMPVGTCRLALPYVKHGDGKIEYLYAKLGSTIDHPREAYATILHSSEDYVCGAVALARSIRPANSHKDLVLLADESITKNSRLALKVAGWMIKHRSNQKSSS